MMLTLEALLELAGDQATGWLTQGPDTGNPMLPMWVLVDKDDHRTVMGTPFQDDFGKELAGRLMRLAMRKYEAVMYSFVFEAWMATAPLDADLSEIRSGWAEKQPDRKEVVFAIAADKDHFLWRVWEIKRNESGKVTSLERQDTNEFNQPEGWVTEMLK